MNRRRMRAPLLLAIVACGGEVPAASDRPVAAAAPTAPQADSLVLEAAGLSVWHTLSREATGSAGEGCLERTLEIRREGAPPVRVPLLYTRDVPRLIDDSTLEARVYRDCAPGDLYRIDARTGQPTPVR